MAKFRKKPVVIEAETLTPANIATILAWSTKARPIVVVGGDDERVYYAEITTLEGVMRAEPSDFIIKGVTGEVYPCKPDIFWMSYEPVED